MRTKRKPPISDADRDEAAKLILAEYFDFLLGGPPPGEGAADSKAVAGRHAAGKGILAHLEQLFKTAGGADGEAGAAEAEAAAGQLDAARAAMASLRAEEAEGDDGEGDG